MRTQPELEYQQSPKLSVSVLFARNMSLHEFFNSQAPEKCRHMGVAWEQRIPEKGVRLYQCQSFYIIL